VLKKIGFILVFLFAFQTAKASHVMGGEITWECSGEQYVFQLIFYRDCNGAEVNTISENIAVWNHPTLTQITVNFISRTDISPTCNPVSGSPVPLDCGTGMGGGNGIGAIEKIVYRSAPISIPGTPSASGWVFTYENFSRSNSLTNISNPSTYGITLAAKMYAIPNGTAGSCVDNSPVFLQEPYMVTCAGTPYVYNMNPIDPDLDSIHVQFGIPYNYLNGGIYNLPSNPAPVPFEPGFSYTSPTPGPGVNPSNVSAQVDPESGELTFTSFTAGNYVLKVTIRSFRYGVLISEVEREMQIAITACAGNNPPVISPPFGGASFETTVIAGTVVNFSLVSTDNENLQDGSPQSNLLTASGLMFGTNFTSNTGCAVAPCATLNATPIISGVQGVTADFSWQTSCDHLVGADGNALDLVPYHFVFRIQDDYCQVPKVSYATVTINVQNPGVIPAPQITCIESDNAGNAIINFSPVTDPSGTFIQYELHSDQSGLITSSAVLGTSSFTVPVASSEDIYVGVVSGCNGNTTRYSDTLSNIFLTLNNPTNGTAILQWNDPADVASSTMGDYYYIMREYPAGNWTLIDSVPYGVNFYKDTIDICQAFLNYQIILPNSPCDFTSNIEGDDFEDMLTPDIPVIQSGSIDTLTGQLNLTWNQNNQPDTYGYVIYTFDANGFIYELDTVWGISNTTYSYSPDINSGPLTYSVAAFDSCWTPAVPPTYQTSAKANVHTTVFVQTSVNVCNSSVNLSWTPYVGFINDITYNIWVKQPGGQWSMTATTSELTYSFTGQVLEEYCFFIEAVSTDGISSFSNPVCQIINSATLPAYNYLQVATVLNDQITLEHLIEVTDAVQAVSIQRQNSTGGFDELIVIPVVSVNITYTDVNVDPQQRSYTYRVQIIDSCGNYTSYSNYARTILLQVSKNDVLLTVQLNWSSYSQFDGSILGYTIYRGIDGNFNGLPLATVGPNVFFYEDSLDNTVFTGKVCYYVEAIEGSNRYDEPKISRSNIACEVFEPIIYVPNAFWPEGINKVFIPVISIFDASDYRFTIFDRWGQAIFNTTSFEEGWNGQLGNSGEMANTGTYIYMITLKDGNGLEVIKRGHVTLLR
jgi:gliding motility-associated-like protein